MKSTILYLLAFAPLLANTAVAQDAPEKTYAKVYRVSDVTVEMEESDAGSYATLSVSATGMVNTGGWSNPELAAWSYIAPPQDGILTFDFIAVMPPPDAIVPMALTPVEATVSGPMPPWVKGVRVVASTNETEVMLEVLPSSGSDPMSTGNVEGDPVADEVLPWPWKNFTPDAMATQ